MKPLKNFKLVIIIGALALSCQKREPEISMYEGVWYSNPYICQNYYYGLEIQHVKVIGKKSNHKNKYKVVGGQKAFLCATSDQSPYYFGEFEFESTKEGGSTAEASDGKFLTFKIEKDSVLRASCASPRWNMTFIKKAK